MFSFVQIVSMIFIKFIFSKAFLKQIILSLIIIVFLTFFTLKWLKSYTNHGITIKVPDLVGLSLNDANKILQKNKLVYKIQDSTNYNPKFKAGAIIEQEPMAGFKVKENRKIYLILNPMDYKKIPFPDVIRKTFRQAKPSLESLGFKIGDIIYEDDLGKNEIIEVRFKNKKILPSDLIRKTSVIDIVLGNGKLSSDSE